VYCTACKPQGKMEDILYNPDCPNCDACDCVSCGLFTGEICDTYCPEGNPCIDCWHINPPIDCPVWPGEGSGKRKMG
jgi:hypothetical protein